jgi:UDP-GlcNAc:undecaprenyl-phosphate GlcNAc-1-phosphate transferase
MAEFTNLATTFILATLAAWVLTQATRWMALRLGVIAKRDLRRRHEGDTPLLGGTPFYLILVAGTLLAWRFPSLFGLAELSARYVACFVGALTAIYGIGFIDDWHELKAPPKFAAQGLAAVLILCSQPELPAMLRNLGLPDWVAATGLILWIVGVTNAVNMIDGLDGLCAGIVGISSVSLAAIAIGQGSAISPPMLVNVLLAGACLGFLVHNFNPAKIFLGDSGSLLLGFVLAVLSVQFEFKRSLFMSLGVPIFLLGIPIADIGLAMFRRTREKRSPFSGDRGHLHHRLQRLGFSHRSVVLLLWGVSGYMSLIAFFLSRIPTAFSLYIYLSVVPTLAFVVAGLYFVERKLSYLHARYGRLFARDGHSLFAPTPKLDDYVREQIEIHRRDKLPFCVIVLDTGELMNQMSGEAPSRVVEYHLQMSAILRDRLRATDLIVRVSTHRIIAVLAGVGAGQIGLKGSVVDYLRSNIQALQIANQVFQSNPKRPEGFRVITYPENSQEILDLVTENSAPKVQTSRRAAS